MRRDVVSGIFASLTLACAPGCATLVTREADLAKAPDGIRIYPPKVCLLVDTGANATVIATFPDLSRAYDVKPLTVLAKQELKLELDGGRLASFAASQDTTAFPRLLTEAAALAAGAAGAGVAASGALEGTFGFDDGVHCLRDDGRFGP